MTVYLARNKRNYLVTLVPAVFMTVVCVTFGVVSPLALGLPSELIPFTCVAVVIIAVGWFALWLRRAK